MSYANVTPSYWQALQPDAPFEAGAPGWTGAPFVGWGQNPNRSTPPMLATDGCGCGRALGDEAAATPQTFTIPVWPVLAGYAVVAVLTWAAFKYAHGRDRAR